MVQDTRGVLYVGTNSGVAEFDGVSWRLIELGRPTCWAARSRWRPTARCLCGAVGDLGYLAPDPAGSMRFVSLLGKVAADARDFADVWRTFATPDGVFFVANRGIYRWSGGTMTVIKPASRFNRASWANGRSTSLCPRAASTCSTATPCGRWPGRRRWKRTGTGGPAVRRAAPPAGHPRPGLFLLDGATLLPFPTAADAMLKAKGPYRGAVLPDGTFAIATLGGG